MVDQAQIDQIQKSLLETERQLKDLRQGYSVVSGQAGNVINPTQDDLARKVEDASGESIARDIDQRIKAATIDLSMANEQHGKKKHRSRPESTLARWNNGFGICLSQRAWKRLGQK